MHTGSAAAAARATGLLALATALLTSGLAAPASAAGETRVGEVRATATTALAAGTTTGSVFSLPRDGVPTAFRFLVRGGSRAQVLVPAVYAVDGRGRPAGLLLQGRRVTVGKGQPLRTVSVAVPGTRLKAGRYLLAVHAAGPGAARLGYVPSTRAGVTSRAAAGAPTRLWRSGKVVSRRHTVSLVMAAGRARPAPTPTSFGAPRPGTSSAVAGAGYTYGSRFDLARSSVVRGLSWHAAGGSRDQAFVPALYSTDRAGDPDELIVAGRSTKVAAGTAARWWTSPVAATALPAGRYVLALTSGEAAGGASTSYDVRRDSAWWFRNGDARAPSRWSPATREDRLWSLRAEFRQVTGGGRATPSPSPTPGTVPKVGPPAPSAFPGPGAAPASPTSSPEPDPGPAPGAGPSPAAPAEGGAVRRPDASTTGNRPGTALRTHQGDLWIKDDGTSVRDLDVRGSLYVTGHRVTVDNVKVAGNVYVNATPSGMLVLPVPSDVVLRHVDAKGVFTNGFDGLTLDAVELHDQLNGPHAQLYAYYDPRSGTHYPARRLLVKGSYFHGVRSSTSSAHLENLHLGGVEGAVIVGNAFELKAPDRATQEMVTANLVIEAPSYGVWTRDLQLTDNWFSGGGYYQVYVNVVGDSRVERNRFLSDSPRYAAVQYPPSSYRTNPPGGYQRFSQSGNTLDGRPYALPGGR